MPFNLNALHRRVCLGAIVLMVTAPFLMAHHYNPIPTFFQEWTAAALSLVALTALLPSRPDRPLELPEIALLPLGLMLIAVLQWIFLRDALTDRLLLFCCYMVWTISLMVLGRHLVRSVGPQSLIELMATAVLVGALLEALTGAVQLAGLARMPVVFPVPAGSLKGNLAQPNNFADYLWLGVVSAIYLRGRGHLGNTSAFCCLLLLIPFGILSGSRSVWFYGAGLTAMSVAWSWKSADEPSKTLRNWSAAPLACALLFQLGFNSGLFPFLADMATSGTRMAQSSYDPIRLALWRMALDAFLESPWLGTGFGLYTRYFHQHVLELMPSRLPGLPEHAHNILLNLLAEMGLAAGLLLLFFGFRWAKGLAAFPRSPETWWIAGIALVLGIHSNLEYPLWYGFFLGFAALLAGVASRSNRPLRLGRTAPYAMAAFLGLGGLTLLNLHRDYGLLEDILNGRVAANSVEERKKVTEEAFLHLARESMLRPYVDFAIASTLAEDANDLETKLQNCERAQHFSASRDIVFKCVHFLALAGRAEESRLALRKAVAAYPDRAGQVLDQWKKLGPRDPAIARLAADFPSIVN